MPERPLYTHENTIERRILDDAEQFFLDQSPKGDGKKLRFDLVKRPLQWMLDTDDNEWFEKADGREPMETKLLYTQRFEVSKNEPEIRSSDIEMRKYMRIMRRDVGDGHLSGEVDALNRYLDKIVDDLPIQYERRRLLLARATTMPEMKWRKTAYPGAEEAHERRRRERYMGRFFGRHIDQ